MTPNRDKTTFGPQLDTGTGSSVAQRPNAWQTEVIGVQFDTGTAEPPTVRPDAFDGDSFIPPKWL